MLKERIARAKELLKTVRHAAMATVNEDGSPHNTPYFLMFDDILEHFYWGSHPDSQHSKNIARTGQAFVVIYDAIGPGGGLYVQLANGHATENDELVTALVVHNKMRARDGKEPLEPNYYQCGPQKMYVADVVKLWVNASERDSRGLIVQDRRYEIKRSDLITG